MYHHSNRKMGNTLSHLGGTSQISSHIDRSEAASILKEEDTHFKRRVSHSDDVFNNISLSSKENNKRSEEAFEDNKNCSFDNCAKDKNANFLLLHKTFCDILRKFNTVLCQKLPSLSISAYSYLRKSSDQTSSNNAQKYNISPGDEIIICEIFQVCEYGTKIMKALEKFIVENIDDFGEFQFELTVTLSDFRKTAKKAFNILFLGLNNRLEKGFRAISAVGRARMNHDRRGTFAKSVQSSFREIFTADWQGKMNGESEYVHYMHDTIQPFVKNVQSLLPPHYFRRFCENFAITFTSTYYDELISQKELTPSASPQLLLDAYSLKLLLLTLPIMVEGTVSVQNFEDKYAKIVTGEFSRIEMLLTLVGTSPELLISEFKSNWQNGSLNDLQRAMMLKGMSQNEQKSILEYFS